MTNQKLLAAAAAVLAAYPDAQEVHVCEDGNVFLPERKQLAQAHCTASRLPAPVAVSRKAVNEAADRVLAAAEAKAQVADVMEVEGRGSDQRTELERRADDEADASRQAIAEGDRAQDQEAPKKAAPKKAAPKKATTKKSK